MNIEVRKKAALQVARETGIFIKRNLGKVGRVDYKGEINLVTDIDRKAESVIINKIRKNFPKDSILSEEAGRKSREGDFLWVIDPIDGTTNFYRSFPFFCVSIAIARNDDILFGVIYDPMRDELFFAKKGRGAFLNRKRIEVSRTKRLSSGFLATGFSYGVRKSRNTNVNNFSRFLKRSLVVRRAGSAALDLAYVAYGRFDGFWELDLHPWDAAAGYLIVREAGGRITRFDGSKYSYLDKDLLASNGLIHNQMISILT